MSALTIEQVFAPAAQLLKHSATLPSFASLNLLPIWLGLLDSNLLAEMLILFAQQSSSPFPAPFSASPLQRALFLQADIASHRHVMPKLGISVSSFFPVQHARLPLDLGPIHLLF